MSSCSIKAKLKAFANLLSLMGFRYVWELLRSPCCSGIPHTGILCTVWACGELLFCSMLEKAEDAYLLNLQIFLQCIRLQKFCDDSHMSWLCSGWIHSRIQRKLHLGLQKHFSSLILAHDWNQIFFGDSLAILNSCNTSKNLSLLLLAEANVGSFRSVS